MTDMSRMREMARDLVRESIMEDAMAQFLAQTLAFVHDDRIKPLQARIEVLETERDAAIGALEESGRKRGETLALLDKAVVALVKAAEEAAEVVHKAYVSATMEAVNAGPSHPLKDNNDKWRVRCLRAEEALRAALAAIREGRK